MLTHEFLMNIEVADSAVLAFIAAWTDFHKSLFSHWSPWL